MPERNGDDCDDEANYADDEGSADLYRNLAAIVWVLRIPNTGQPSLGVVRACEDLLVADRVQDKADQGERVAEDLDQGDMRVPDKDGGANEEDALENATKGHDETGSLANLPGGISLVELWIGESWPRLTRNTLTTLRRKATDALRSSIP